MSRQYQTLLNPNTGEVTQVYLGFSFPCLFVGFLWYIAKGMYLIAAIHCFSTIITLGLSWFIFPIFANKQYFEHLVNKGYLTGTISLIHGQQVQYSLL